MKRKYFLFGLGVGIILTTLVLCIAYRKHNSEETVVQRAEELGMIFPKPTSDALLVPSGTAVSITMIPATEEPEPTREPKGAGTREPSATSKPGREEMPEPIETPDVTGDGEVLKSTRTFKVREGLLSSSVAREMKEAGVIKDADAFDRYMEENGMGKNIRSGKYKIPVGASYEEIAKIITRQKESDNKGKKRQD